MKTAFVVMVNDFPVRAVVGEREALVAGEPNILAAERAERRAKWLKMHPQGNPDDHPMEVGHVHIHEVPVSASPSTEAALAALLAGGDLLAVEIG